MFPRVSCVGTLNLSGPLFPTLCWFAISLLILCSLRFSVLLPVICLSWFDFPISRLCFLVLPCFRIIYMEDLSTRVDHLDLTIDISDLMEQGKVDYGLVIVARTL